MTQEEIDKINHQCPYGQGIFFQPNGVPLHIKEHVIYSKYDYRGKHGGSCWGDEPSWYHNDPPKDHFRVLDLVLRELHPQCTYLQYREIQSLIESDEDRSYEYYGNFSDWKVEWIVLSELEKLIESWESQS